MGNHWCWSKVKVKIAWIPIIDLVQPKISTGKPWWHGSYWQLHQNAQKTPSPKFGHGWISNHLWYDYGQLWGLESLFWVNHPDMIQKCAQQTNRYRGGAINRGRFPKWSLCFMENRFKIDDLGVPPIYGNLHIDITLTLSGACSCPRGIS